MPTRGKDGKYHSKVTPAPGVKPVYFEAATLKEFNAKREQIIREYVTGRKMRDVSFLAMADEWYAIVKKPRIRSKSSLHTYESLMRTVRDGFPPSLLCRAVRYPVLQQFLDRFKGKNYDFLIKLRRLLNDVCRYAVVEGAMEANYADALAMPLAGTPKKKGALTSSQAAALLRGAESFVYGVVVYIGYYTGARLGEILALRWRDVDLQANQIHFHEAVIQHEPVATKLGPMKTENAERYTPIPPALREILLPLRALPDTFVCPLNSYGQMVNQVAFRNAFTEMLLSSGLAVQKEDGHVDREITMHWLRHNYATACYRAHIPLTVTMSWLGHADMRTTSAIYADIKKALQINADLDDHLKCELEKVGQKLDAVSLMW